MLKSLKNCLSFFGYPRVLYQTDSKINGKITVISQFGQNSISVQNLTQTGPVIDGLWKFAVKKVLSRSIQPKKILVLGVGGGSVIRTLRLYFPQAEITGIEIDNKMIEIANKYFNINKYKAFIIVDNAFDYVFKSNRKFDLIIIDILIGRKTPKKLFTYKFYRQLKNIMSAKAIGIINRLRSEKFESNDTLILKHLNSLFSKIEYETPLINRLVFFQ